MILKIVKKHKYTRYEVRRKMNMYPYTFNMSFSSFYTIFRWLLNDDLIIIIDEKLKYSNRTKPMYRKPSGKIRGYCHLTKEGNKVMVNLENRIKMIVM